MNLFRHRLRFLRNRMTGRGRFSLAEPEDPQIELLVKSLGEHRRQEIRIAFIKYQTKKKKRLIAEAKQVAQLELFP